MKLLKILGIVLVSFIGSFVLIFFLYPYINEEKYSEMLESEQGRTMADMAWAESGVPLDEFENLQKEFDRLQSANRDLLNKIDSLEIENEELRHEIKEWENMEEFLPGSGLLEEQAAARESVTEQTARQDGFVMDEEFGERVKSLLNLDEEELAPIVRELDQEKLIRLYQSGGTIQREKLLRSLEPARAAALMSEVM